MAYRSKKVWQIKPVTPKPGRTSFLQHNDLDRLIMKELSIHELNSLVVNHKIQTILDDNIFWCQWLQQHHHIIVQKDCKEIANKLRDQDMEVNYFEALQHGDVNVVKALYDNHLFDPQDLVFTGEYREDEYDYDSDDDDDDGRELVAPIIIAVDNGRPEMAEYLLTFKPDIHYINAALTCALYQGIGASIIKILLKTKGLNPGRYEISEVVKRNDLTVMKLLLDQYTFKKPLFDYLLKTAVDRELWDMVMLFVRYKHSPIPEEIKKQLIDHNRHSFFNNMRIVINQYLSI